MRPVLARDLEHELLFGVLGLESLLLVTGAVRLLALLLLEIHHDFLIYTILY